MVFEGFWSMENRTFNQEGDNFQIPICSAKRSIMLGGGQIGERHKRGFEFQFKSFAQHGIKHRIFGFWLFFRRENALHPDPKLVGLHVRALLVFHTLGGQDCL